ncbi:MAG: hypothetical protein WC769_13040 [Thermodesulfovibrionales bacterium]|jgi:tyrosyl-tRNA synthetase
MIYFPYLPKLLCLCGLTKSNSEARRLIDQGAVKIIDDDETVTVPKGYYHGEIKDNDIMQIGRKFMKVKI